MASKVRIHTDPLTPALQEKAKKELRETPEQIKESVAKLKELLQNDKSLRFGVDDENLIRYLRPTKYYPDSAHALIKRVCEFKDKHKDILANLVPQNMEELFLSETFINVFVDRDQEGRRILLLKQGSAWNPSKVSADQVFQALWLIHLAALLEPATQVSGIVVIIDYDGLGMKQVTALSPGTLLRLLTFIQEACPLRIKEIHVVNQPMIFNMLWSIIKPLLKEKLKKRWHMHGSKMGSLHEFVKPDHLPKEYGGQLPAIDYSGKNWYPEITKHVEFIKENNTYGLAK